MVRAVDKADAMLTLSSAMISGAIYRLPFFNPVWHRTLYICAHMAAVGIKGLTKNFSEGIATP